MGDVVVTATKGNVNVHVVAFDVPLKKTEQKTILPTTIYRAYVTVTTENPSGFIVDEKLVHAPSVMLCAIVPLPTAKALVD